MATVATKTQILEAAGYKYNFDREVYFNRKAKKTFSVEFVEDHKEHEIEQYIQESTPEMEWHFYFNSPPSEGVKRQLAMILTNA